MFFRLRDDHLVAGDVDLPSVVWVTGSQRTATLPGEMVFWSAFSSGTTVGLTICGGAGSAWVNRALPTRRLP